MTPKKKNYIIVHVGQWDQCASRGGPTRGALLDKGCPRPKGQVRHAPPHGLTRESGWTEISSALLEVEEGEGVDSESACN